MANMQMTKTPMPEQDPNVRNKNFKEVTLGYTAEMAINEAQRCMQCKKPKCVEGCPVNIRIPEFIAKVAEAISPRPMRSSPPRTRCLRSPVVSVRRRRSASPSACAA